MFTKINQVLRHRASLNKFQRSANIQTTLINQNTIKVEIHNTTTGPKLQYILKFQKHAVKLLNKIKIKVTKYLELNNN